MDTEPPWVGDVLRFWFEELDKDHWFARDDGLDARIRDRFMPLHGRLVTTGASGIGAPRALLAAVIVLDQFSRNMFRGTTQAFSGDAIARRLSRKAIESGVDAGMTAEERSFLYLPFQHSEDREDQALSLRLFERLGNDEWTRDARAHKDVIDRFGRFPHRNAVLKRASTTAELALLSKPMSWF